MIDENFKRLFIATHLLYPNSAQARDIVFQISTQLRNKTEKRDPKEQLSMYFSALVQIYRRVASIKSGFKFFEFKDQKLNDWKTILKKCNVNEILIFLGVSVLKLEIDEIAKVLNFTPNQVRYLFGLSVRKAIGSSENQNLALATIPAKGEFKFRQYNDSDITYSNLIEKTIDFIFIDRSKGKKISFDGFIQSHKQHLSDRNQGNISFLFNKVFALAQEVDQIEIDEPFLIEFQKEAKSFNNKTRIKLNLDWRWVGVASVIMVSFTMFFLRPDFRLLFESEDQIAAIEIKEIAFKVSQNEDSSGTPDSLAAAPEVLNVETNLAESNPKASTNTLGSNSTGDAKTKSNETATLDPINPVSIDVNPVGPIVAVKPTSQIPSTPPKAAAAVNPAEATKPTKITKQVVNPTPTEPAVSNTATEPTAAGKMQGGVYRAELSVKDLEQMSMFTKERIVGFGGKKAGEVELGWVKNAKTTYFHFSLPEENVEKLKADLEKLGQLQISFSPHPRLMPAGVKRFILEVRLSE